MINLYEVTETNKMIEEENLDVRTITLGISLLDCIDSDLDRLNEKIYNKIYEAAKDLVKTGEEISREFGIPIVNKRISVTPIALIGGAACHTIEDFASIAKTLDKVAHEVGVNFLGGYSALVSKGMTPADELLIRSIPLALSTTERVCSSVNLGSTKTGINMDAVKLMGEMVRETAEYTKEDDSLGCAKLVVFCNAPDDNPFMAGAFHGVTEADAIINDIRGLLKSFKIKIYNEDTGYGLLRHVLIRRGFSTGEIMVVLVLGSPVMPSKNNFVKALRKLHPEITTVILNVNDKRTSMVLGDRETTIYGKGYIEDVLCGLKFRISSKSFYQINPVQTEKLYGKAMELAGLSGTERVIDAYCGIGTIGMVAAKSAKEVIGVELNPDAVRDAVKNAKHNQMKNIRFYQEDAGRFMEKMAALGEKADVVFMDPPRSGSTEQFMKSVVTLAPKKIVYISCDPQTQARDLKYLTRHGYKAMGAYPYDMFPFTKHAENIVLLTKN